jgi:hypothetical protein
MSSGLSAADDIRRRMADIRSDLHQNMRGVVHEASNVADWRSYVRQRPWLALGLSFTAGYLVVPRRTRPSNLVVPQVVETPSVAATQRRRPLRPVRWLLGLVGPILLRTAQNYAMSHIENLLASNQFGPAQDPWHATTSSPGRTDHPGSSRFE